MSIIFTVIILGIIISVHELGHFLAAKYYKMPVSEFAIGMGPKIISKKIGETTYSVRMLPLGGFVNIGGMQYEEIPEYGEEGQDIENSKKFMEEEIEVIRRNNRNGFFTKSPLARFIVLISGVMMNFSTALIGIFIMMSVIGTAPAKYTDAVIGSVSPESKVQGQLFPGDKITEFDGKKIRNWSNLTETIALINGSQSNPGEKEFSIKVRRNGKEVEDKVMLTYNSEMKSYILGIQVKKEKMSFLSKIGISLKTFGDYFKMTFEGLKMLVTGKVSPKEITGPVGLPRLVGQAYEIAGYMALLNIFILLSINIGLMNLLPVPALDGGRLLFVVPEFFGIKMNKKIEEKLHLIGMILLFGLMIFVMLNDIIKLF